MMCPIKKYENVDTSAERVSFNVARMEDIYSKRNGVADEPHRHEYYTILIVKDAQGTHKIDFQSYELSDGQVFFVAPGQVHQIVEEEKSLGYVLTFSTQFLIEHSIRLTFVEKLDLFRNYGDSPPLEPSEQQFDRIHGFTKEIFTLHQGQTSLKMHSIAAFLKLLLIECNEICDLDPRDSMAGSSGNALIKDFKSLVAQHHRKERSTSYYAEKLHISSDHLNRIIKSKLGNTAKEYIQARITIEAKRLLYFSNLSTKEIAFELGFSEPANFSAFFKKCTGLSPSEFKRRERSS